MPAVPKKRSTNQNINSPRKFPPKKSGLKFGGSALQLTKQVEAYRGNNQQLPVDFPESLKDVVEDWQFETDMNKEGVWLHSDYGSQDTACAFIRHLLEQFGFAPAVAFEWSHDCSQPRTDAFGGGAAFVTATEIETFSTAEWVQKVAH